MLAVSGLLVILYSQFGPYCIDTYGTSGTPCYDGNEIPLDANIIFEIRDKPKFDDDELYDFNWLSLKAAEECPFCKYGF